MTTVDSSSNPPGRDATGTVAERSLLILLCLLLGFSFYLPLHDIRMAFSLRLDYLLPLLAAWLVRHNGLAALIPLTLMSLLPDAGVDSYFGHISFGFSDTACLVAVGVVLAYATGDEPSTVAKLVRPSCRLMLSIAIVTWIFAASHGVYHLLPVGGLDIKLDTLALPGLAGALSALDWRRMRMVIGERAANVVAVLAGLSALSLMVRLSFDGGGLSLGLGSATASSLVPAACFVAILCDWVTWRRLVIALGLTAALGQIVVWTVGPLTWTLGAHGYAEPWSIFFLGVAAGALGRGFAALRESTPRSPLPARWFGSFALAVLAVLWSSPALNIFLDTATAIWVLAGFSFLVGQKWGVRAVIGMPLAAFAVPFVGVYIGNLVGEGFYLYGRTPILVGVMLTYALGGWFVKGRKRRSNQAYGGEMAAESHLDVSAVARVVQRIDNRTAWRSFAVLAAPALSLSSTLPEFAGIASFINEYGIAISVEEMIVPLFVLAVLSPAMFLMSDWMDRQDRLRVISGVTGGALALLVGPISTFALLGIVTLVYLALSERYVPPWEVLVVLAVAMPLLVAWWIRAIRLRLILFEDHPRELLFGELPKDRFWARVAALLGLPSSMWNISEGRALATWAILLSRSLVYLGVHWLLTSAPFIGAATVAAGHAAFSGGKRMAARSPWRPLDESDPRGPVLFLRSFEDDQFDFQPSGWQLRQRWFDLWSFRRNLDEAMIDEVAQYGPVVALGRPGETGAPFGARRYYADQNAWQDVVIRTSRRARAIVLVAGESPGLRWEFDMLRREGLVNRTILLLHPDPQRSSSNMRAVQWLLGDGDLIPHPAATDGVCPVALLHTPSGPRMLTVSSPSAAAYVVALRTHFQQISPQALASVAD